MPSTDSAHQYIYRSGEYGSMYQYWYRDPSGNYYRYTNAPVDSPDFDPFLGLPLMDPEQPLPEKNPEFFTTQGFKRSIAIPPGAQPTQNPAYNQKDAANLWFEALQQGGKTIYVYLDADVRENLDLYVQNQLRVVDSNIPKLRQYATQLFAGTHTKDRLTGAIIMLVDQGYYGVEELVNATVGDVQFVDQAVILLGRKMICDLNFFDFITSLVSQRSPQESLFMFDTMHGRVPVGKNYLYSVFATCRTSPKFLLQWNASHLYSRIVNRMSFQQIPVEVVETQAFDELARTLTTREDVKYLVDFKVRVALMRNYATDVAKSITHLTTDDFGVVVIRSDLTSFRPDEKEFSDWLRTEPMHDTSPAEEQQLDAALQQNAQTQQVVQERPEVQQSPEDAPEAPAIPPGEVPA